LSIFGSFGGSGEGGDGEACLITLLFEAGGGGGGGGTTITDDANLAVLSLDAEFNVAAVVVADINCGIVDAGLEGTVFIDGTAAGVKMLVLTVGTGAGGTGAGAVATGVLAAAAFDERTISLNDILNVPVVLALAVELTAFVRFVGLLAKSVIGLVLFIIEAHDCVVVVAVVVVVVVVVAGTTTTGGGGNGG
jgi:hypothetical protein